MIRKNRQAWFYFISFIFLFLGAIFSVLSRSGVIENSLFTIWSFKIGLVIQILLLSLGLADQVNSLKNSLQLFSRDLEKKVDERTEELSEANEKLQEMDRLKTNFFSNISHEIRTPLTLILTPVAQALQNTSEPADTRDFLESIHRNALRLLELINNILDFSKIEEGRMSLNVRTVNIVQTVREYLGTIESAAHARQMELSYTFDQDEILLYIDLEKFEKISMNLFSNALKFTDDGGFIRVTIHTKGSYCHLIISDSGIGIPAEAITTIFDRFSQADSSSTRHYEGTGIGLALVKELTELHGGQVTVESRYIEEYPDTHGTSFTLSLPLGKDHLAGRKDVDFLHLPEEEISHQSTINIHRYQQSIDASLTSSSEKSEETIVQDTASTASPYSLLIVEDNADMRRMLTNLLAPIYTLHIAVHGLEGLEKAAAHTPDLIITDVMMPEMDGHEMTKRLKENPLLCRIPVLMLTAKSETSQKIEGIEFGADDYLTKPFDARELRVRVHSLLEKRQYERLIEQRNNEIEKELETARLLQRRLLPQSLPEIPGYQSAVRYIPMDKVGGDFYDMRFHDNTIELFIADVSGHGLPGAFLATVTKMALDTVDNGLSPAAVLREINSVILNATVNYNYVTAFHAVIDITTRRMTYSSAGHFPPLVYRAKNDSFHELKTKGNPLGWFDAPMLNETSIDLESGDRILLYTDGIIESMNSDKEEYADNRFMDFIRSHSDLSPDEFQEALITDLHQFTGEESFDDDVCIITVDVE